MYIDWKLSRILSILLTFTFTFSESHGTLTNQQQRGGQQTYQNAPYHPQHHPFHHQQAQTDQANQPEYLKTKCKLEVPSVSLKAYPYAKQLRAGATTHLTLIETCCDGYEAHKANSDGGVKCLPVCENCLNGYCVRPGECECFQDFVKNDNGDCVFTCPISCLNGQCYLDGTCKCHQGYKLDETKKFCRPICSKGCLGWMHNCTAPEACGCSNGYTLEENGCAPICQPDCGIGGICREPNVCECYEDYTLKNGVCQSNCYQKCENGICLSRNRCICYPGFRYHEKTATCIPA